MADCTNVTRLKSLRGKRAWELKFVIKYCSRNVLDNEKALIVCSKKVKETKTAKEDK